MSDKQYDDVEEPDEPQRDYDDPEDVTEDFDAFWDSHSPVRKRETARICGVVVHVPTDIPLAVEFETERLGASSKTADVRRMVAHIFGEDVLDAWVEAGMTEQQFAVVLAWGMANGKGTRVTFPEAAKVVAEADGGKVPVNRAERRAADRNRGARSASTGR